MNQGPEDAVGIAFDVRAGNRSALDWPSGRSRGSRRATRCSTASPPCSPPGARRRPQGRRGARRGRDPGPLAGVPFAVKNLFDVAGEVTVAGSRISADDPPASADAEAVRRLSQAGGVLVGMLNMDEYAYGFTTENTHYGPCRNPHDPTRVAGGSSGGSGAAVAAGFVPLTLGSDTNGSCASRRRCAGF